MNNSEIISVKNLTKKFPMGMGEFTALNGINLTFEKGEFAGVVGPSGSGKTTLLNIIWLLDNPTDGDVEVLGSLATELSVRDAALMRRMHMGFIFQTYNLLPVYSVYENTEFPLRIELGSDISEKPFIVFIANSKWCQPHLIDTSLYNVGFKIVDMSSEALESFKKIYNLYGSEKSDNKLSNADYLWR